jgi:hypothetical protein
VSRRESRPVAIGIALVVGLTLVTAGVAVPVVLLLHVNDETLSRWSQIGQALEPVGVFFSGVAFIGIALTLFLQSREHAYGDAMGSRQRVYADFESGAKTIREYCQTAMPGVLQTPDFTWALVELDRGKDRSTTVPSGWQKPASNDSGSSAIQMDRDMKSFSTSSSCVGSLCPRR